MAEYIVAPKKTISLTSEDLKDILCSCIEGGCGYWAMIDSNTDEFKEYETKLSSNADYTIEDVIVAMWEDDKPLTLWEDEEDASTYTSEHHVFLSHFLNGIQKSIEEGYWDGQDICDIDGEVGDCIMQLACFEEVIYG